MQGGIKGHAGCIVVFCYVFVHPASVSGCVALRFVRPDEILCIERINKKLG